MTPRFPFPPNPVGWFAVASSAELGPRGVLPVTAFGRELVVWRGDDGVARVSGAYCPHLGAHLGHGGRVEGQTLTCPFHGWCYDGDGACVSIPYPVKIPPRAHLEMWPAREVAGLVLAHHHPAGEAPAWEPPALPEAGAPTHEPSKAYSWIFRSHVQEVAENVVDPAHFLSVHHTASLPETTARVEDAARFVCESHMMQRTPRGEVRTGIETTMYGLGLMTLRFTGIVDTLAVGSVTPIDGERIHFRITFHVSRADGGGPHHGVGAALVLDITRQVDADIPIWEHKMYRERPLLCAADEAIVALRRWARGLYA